MAIDEDLEHMAEGCFCWKLSEDKGFYRALECGSDWCKAYRGKKEDKSKE